MKRLLAAASLFALVLAAPNAAPVQAAPAPARNLEFYWIDVEGGAATLIVSPTFAPTWKAALPNVPSSTLRPP